MADVKVSALTALTGANLANGDQFLVTDVGTPNVSKSITADELAQGSQFSSRYSSRASTSGRFAAVYFTGVIDAITSTTWADLDTDTDLTLTGVTAGDVIQVGLSFAMSDSDPITFFDVVSLVSGSPQRSWGVDGAPADSQWGIAGLASSANNLGRAAVATRACIAGDLSAGSLTLRVRTRLNSAGTSTLHQGGNVPFHFWARNLQ